MALGTRERRIRRVREALPIVEELEEFTAEVYADDLFTTEEGHDASPLWLATPFSHTRDSELRDKCNWEVVSEDLLSRFPGTVRDPRFGHWGWGWSERIYVRRDDALALRAVQAWVDAIQESGFASEERYDAAEREQYDEYLSSQLGGYPGVDDDEYRDRVRRYLFEAHSACRSDDVDQNMIKDAITHVYHPYERWEFAEGEEECYFCNQPASAECHTDA